MAGRPPSLDPPASESPHITPRELQVAIPPAKRTIIRVLSHRRRLSIALGILAASPALVGLLLLPTGYLRPMFESIVGWLLLAILAVSICVGYALLEAARRLIRKGPVVLGVLLLVGYSMTWLVAVWIVLLGPAALILMKPRS
jgi:cation transport ATPase